MYSMMCLESTKTDSTPGCNMLRNRRTQKQLRLQVRWPHEIMRAAGFAAYRNFSNRLELYLFETEDEEWEDRER